MIGFVGDLDARVVVQDRASATAVCDRSVGGAAEIHLEGFIRFDRLVALHRDGDRLALLAGVEGERAGLGGVIAAAARAAVRRGVFHRALARGAAAAGDGEGEVARPAVAFGFAGIVDRQLARCRGDVVVLDRALRESDPVKTAIEHGDKERLIHLDLRVAFHIDGDGLRGLPGEKREHARHAGDNRWAPRPFRRPIRN